MGYVLALALLCTLGGARAQGLFASVLPTTCNNAVPSPPIDLKAPPANRPCGAVSYTAIVRALPIDPSAAPAFAWTGATLGTGIDGLDPKKAYQVAVTATAQGRSGAPAYLSLVPTALLARPSPSPKPADAPASAVSSGDWKCVAAPSYTPCQAAAMGMCTPATCKDMASPGWCAAQGLCDRLREYDWASRTVKQGCGAECGCPMAPILGAPRMRAAQCCAYAAGDYYPGSTAASTNNLYVPFRPM
eukprot:scaffold9.g3201.t1